MKLFTEEQVREMMEAFYNGDNSSYLNKEPMENKQTAVEWLEEQFIWMIEDGVDWFDAFHSVMSKLEQAKQMEKEQIKDSFVECWQSNVPDGIECKLDAEQYYNENYKQQDK